MTNTFFSDNTVTYQVCPLVADVLKDSVLQQGTEK
jgi:hypothetical protein